MHLRHLARSPGLRNTRSGAERTNIFARCQTFRAISNEPSVARDREHPVIAAAGARQRANGARLSAPELREDVPVSAVNRSAMLDPLARSPCPQRCSHTEAAGRFPARAALPMAARNTSTNGVSTSRIKSFILHIRDGMGGRTVRACLPLGADGCSYGVDDRCRC